MPANAPEEILRKLRSTKTPEQILADIERHVTKSKGKRPGKPETPHGGTARQRPTRAFRIDIDKLLKRRSEAPPLPTVARQGKRTGAPLGNLDLVGRLNRMTGDIQADIASTGRGRGGASAAKAGGIVIAEEFRAPHTLRDKRGRHVRTDRWFDRCGLCYDAGLPADAQGGENHPMLWIGGTEFRCYYPRSTRSDFASMFSSGSTGRWLNHWPLKSQYISF